MTFEWNPGAEDEIKKMAMRKIEARARPIVEGTVCPDHGKSPRLVRRGNAVRIEGFCCRKVAEMASKSAGLGDIAWHDQPTAE